MNDFLQSGEWVDWRTTEVLACAKELRKGHKNDVDIAKACFEFVRDCIKHSADYHLNPVTCKASDVLRHQTGYCYAKSHLLAALLRANGIPAALCYQRLTLTDTPPFCLHGLNAVYLQDYGWYRADARGNKPDVDAQFHPPLERLAFAMTTKGEKLFDELYSQPHPQVVEVLTSGKTWDEVYRELPDLTTL